MSAVLTLPGYGQLVTPVHEPASDPPGLDTLITALGGNTHVPYAYERRANWSATLVKDARASGGTAVTLSPTGTPTLDGSGNLVFASGEDMHSAANAIFKITTAGSLLVVAKITADGTNAVGLSPSATPTCSIDVEGASGKVGVFTDTDVLSLVAESATLIPIVVTWDGSQAVTIQAPNQTIVSHTNGNVYDAGNGVLCLGGFFTASGTNGGCTIACAIGTDHQVNSTEVTAFTTYATTELGATAQ